MADKRVPVSFELVGNEIHRRKGEADKIIEDKVVALYDAETKLVTFPSLYHIKNFKEGVITFLAENELTVRDFVRADMAADPKKGKSIPERPKKDRMLGDKTPAVVQWYFDHKPNAFAARYGVLGRYTGKVTILEPQWVERKIDKLPEYLGASKVEMDVVNVLVATRATEGLNHVRLTYTEAECIEWDGEEPDADQETESSGKEASES